MVGLRPADDARVPDRFRVHAVGTHRLVGERPDGLGGIDVSGEGPHTGGDGRSDGGAADGEPSDDWAADGEAPDDGSTPSDGGQDEPLADLAADVDSRRQGGEGDLFDSAFDEQPYEEMEDGTVWDAVEEEQASEFGAVGEVVEAGERTYVVSKRNFCERCRHFSGPPDVHCTHDGTEIREFVDMDHVRLHSCPIVEERGLGGEGPAE